MSNYSVKLTPNFTNPATEGSLDTSMLDGKSLQRTINMYEVDNNGNRKMISGKDGGEFNDTTFQNSNGVGTFESTPSPYFAIAAKEKEESIDW